jgi:hypothetical protein
MKESDETKLHKKLQPFCHEYIAEAEFGKIYVTLDAIPNFEGGKGCPDEIITVKTKISLLGSDIEVTVPILVELESSGSGNAMKDLQNYSERTISGEQSSYIHIPMIVVGGQNQKFVKDDERILKARFSINQVPIRMIL